MTRLAVWVLPASRATARLKPTKPPASASGAWKAADEPAVAGSAGDDGAFPAEE